MTEVTLMAHVLFGVACMLLSVGLFADVWHAKASSLARIRGLSLTIALVMWIAFIIGGYWYVTYYKVDKAIILKGPWPFAHNFVMETKEHLVIMLLLLVTYLPIAARNDLADNKGARKIMLWVTALIALLALGMDGEGAIIAMGVKMGLLPH